MQLIAKILRKLAASIVVVIAAILVSEAALAVMSLASPRFRTMLSFERPEIYDSDLGIRPNPNYPGHDRKGFRNRAVPKDVFLVALGDSQTYGVGVRAEQAWPQQVESLEKKSVYNMAYGGYGPTHYLLLLNEAIAMHPKLIVVTFYTGNDLYDSYSHVYTAGRLPELRSDDKDVIKSLIDAENTEALAKKIAKYSSGNINPIMGVLSTASPVLKYLSEHSRLCILGAKVFDKLSGRSSGNSGSLEKFDFGQLHTVFTAAYRGLGTNLKDVRIVEGWRLSLEAIRLMEKKVRELDIAFMVLLIPTKELVFKDMVAEKGMEMSSDYTTLIENEEKIMRETTRFLRSQKIVCVDTLPFLRKSLSHGRQPYPQSWDGHPNETGHREIAEAVIGAMEKDGSNYSK
jgi:hypothetical protein